MGEGIYNENAKGKANFGALYQLVAYGLQDTKLIHTGYMETVYPNTLDGDYFKLIEGGSIPIHQLNSDEKTGELIYKYNKHMKVLLELLPFEVMYEIFKFLIPFVTINDLQFEFYPNFEHQISMYKTATFEMNWDSIPELLKVETDSEEIEERFGKMKEYWNKVSGIELRRRTWIKEEEDVLRILDY